jgi:Holliday junction resolvase RusA-like endonuclease
MDADNALKVLNDAIAIGLGIDDRRFLPHVVEKTTGNAEPSVLIQISTP